MELLKKIFKKKPRNLWNYVNSNNYHTHVTISSIDSSTKSKEIDDRVIYINEIEKRKEAYCICGECNEPGTGWYWCQPSEWPEGYIWYWDIKNQKWKRDINRKIALKSLDNSSEICTDFINEIKSYLQIYILNIVYCFGISQDPNTKDYMMVLEYCENGNLRNLYLNNFDDNIKLYKLSEIANGLLSIHNAEKVHKDFHSGNILLGLAMFIISDLGMCQPANNKEKFDKKEGVYGTILDYFRLF
ncbi:kinase-like protein [Rhizophagus irregularis]|uniref:Kinase-like protein n=1 Tax=Rhizophagus irregularis TaxID=588596 RepID=A0A2N1M2J4_9GLOM|nr:kinase-like protein [Rhizophagus irregularis]